MPNLTADQKKQIKENIYKEINEFVETKDYDGFYHYFRKKLDDVEHGTPEQAEENLFRKNCINDFVQENGDGSKPEMDAFIHSFMQYCYVMEHTRIMETSKTYEEIKTRLKNGEVKDAELIADQDKTVDKLALGLTVNASMAGRKMMQAKGITAAMTQALADTPGFKQLKADLKKEFDVYLKNEPTYSEEESKKYRVLFSNQALIDVADTGLSGAKVCFKIDLGKDDLSFTQVPDGITGIQAMDIRQLKEYHAQLTQERNTLYQFEQAGKSWGDTAGQLLSDLEKVPGFDKKDPAFAPIYKALNNAKNVGNGEYSFGDGYMATAKRLSHKSATFTFQDVISKAETLMEKAPEIATEIIMKASEAQTNFNNNYAAGADKVFDTYKADATQAQVKMLDKRIQRVENQLLYKNMCAEDPHFEKRLKNRIETIGSIDTSHNLMRQLMADTMDAVLISNTVKDFLDNDKKTRDLTKGDHKDYNNFVAAIDGLQDLKKQDMRQMNYQQIMEKLTAARDASKAYMDSHDGLLHLGSGWSGKGRDRIGNAKYIYQKLDRQIREMKATYDSEFAQDTQTLGTREETYLITKENLRKENAAERKKIATKLDEKLFTSTMQTAMSSLAQAKTQAGQDKYPQAGDVADQYAMILAVGTALQQSKAGGYGANERKLGILKNNIKNSPEFAEMVKAHTSEELFKAATDQKNPKALSDMFAKKQPQAEKVKQPAKGL